MAKNNKLIQDTSTEESRGETVKLLIDLLNGGHAHADFESAVSKVPAESRGVKPAGLPYSIWQLLEHIRITQHDILEFSRDEKYKSPVWPEGYWPADAVPKGQEWKESIAQIKNDREAFINLLTNKQHDLYAPFPYGDGQNLLREALLIADHTSYHVGEIIVIRRILGIW